MNQNRLKELFLYDDETGAFFRKLKTHLKLAGSTRKDGYIRIGVDSKLYYAHQLAWLYKTGEWCSNIDHRDTNPSNNAWCNLRSATGVEQQFNQKNLKCFYFDKQRMRYRTLIQIAGKKIYGKSCKTEDEAKTVADALKRKHHGEFYFGEVNG